MILADTAMRENQRKERMLKRAAQKILDQQRRLRDQEELIMRLCASRRMQVAA